MKPLHKILEDLEINPKSLTFYKELFTGAVFALIMLLAAIGAMLYFN